MCVFLPPGLIRAPAIRPLLALSTLFLFIVIGVEATEQLKHVRDTVLEEKIAQRLQCFAGDTGVFIRRLRDGRTVAIRADEIFPTASLIKVPLLAALSEGVTRGQWNWETKLPYDPARIDYAPGDDLLAKMKPGEMLELRQIAALMLAFSDNHASLWVQDLVGGGGAVNALLERKGFHATRVNSRTPGREAEKAKFGWGQTSPREMAELLVRIAEHRLLDPKTDERMQRMLGRSQVDGEALSILPPDVHAESKQGAVDRSRSEVLVIHAPHGAYVLCLITQNQKDISYSDGNDGFVLLRDVSRLVWDHFEGRRAKRAE